MNPIDINNNPSINRKNQQNVNGLQSSGEFIDLMDYIDFMNYGKFMAGLGRTSSRQFEVTWFPNGEPHDQIECRMGCGSLDYQTPFLIGGE